MGLKPVNLTEPGRPLRLAGLPSGRCFHLRAKPATARTKLARLSTAVAILGHTPSWTSFFPVEPGFRPEEAVFAMSLGSRTEVLEIAYAGERGVRFRIYSAGSSPSSIGVSWGEPFETGSWERMFFGALEGCVSAKKVEELRDLFHHPPATRDAWLAKQGLEAALGLPVREPVAQQHPLAECEAVALASLRERWPEAEAIEPEARKPHPPREIPTLPELTDAQRATISLHVFYLCNVWPVMGNQKLLARYRKHLPKERRGEADGLVDRVMRGASDEELEAVIAHILEGLWEAEDWDALIRSPAMLVNVDDESALTAWAEELRGRLVSPA